MTEGLSSKEKRVLNPRPFRHYRKTYSLTEVRLGLAIVVVLAAIAAWIAWRGRHPDPKLYGDPAAVAGAAKTGAAAAGAATSGDRGALPAAMAPAGWAEGAISRFDASNLYVKIDGRADFFLSRGFVSLTFVSVSDPKAPGTLVDVELYDMASPENARSAYTGEKPPDVASTDADGSSWYLARNALFLARGKHFARLIGSDETPPVKAALEHVRDVLMKGLAAGERPWTHALFGDALGIPPDRISFAEENAFSFGFAKGVHSGTLADDTELFVMPAADASAAKGLAAQFEKGFLGYGEAVKRGDATWVKDRYLGSFSRTTVVKSFVVGVRGAPKVEEAEKALEKLTAAVAALPPGAGHTPAGPPPGPGH